MGGGELGEEDWLMGLDCCASNTVVEQRQFQVYCCDVHVHVHYTKVPHKPGHLVWYEISTCIHAPQY